MAKTGNKTVAAAGTAERLVALTADLTARVGRRVRVEALHSNTNPVVVGQSSDVDTAAATDVGSRLDAGEFVEFNGVGCNDWIDASGIWVDVTTNGEGVTYTISEG